MGTWGVGLYENDTAADVRDGWLKKLKLGASGEEATAELLKEWGNTDSDPILWLALADLQWRWGRLEASVRERALQAIAGGGDLHLWEGHKERAARARVLKRLEARLQMPPPPPKTVRVRGDAIAWRRGQLWSYSTLDGKKVVLRVAAIDPKGGIVPGPVMELLDVSFEGEVPPDGLDDVGLRTARETYNASGYYNFVPSEHRASPMFMPKVMERGGFPRHRLKKLRSRGEPRPMDIDAMGYIGLPWWYLDNFLADKFDVGGPRAGAIHGWTLPDGSTAYTVVELAYWRATDLGAMWQLGLLDCREPAADSRLLDASPVIGSLIVSGFAVPGTFREIGHRQPDKDVAQVSGVIHKWANLPAAIEKTRFYQTDEGKKAAAETIARVQREIDRMNAVKNDSSS